jgi:hypothetical protein
MFKMSRNRILVISGVVLGVVLIALAVTENNVFGQQRRFGPPAGSGGIFAPPAHYTVVMTEAHNLLVTDNATNKLYFYTIDKDKPIGSPLKLRASVDLTQVGEQEVKITPHNLEKVEEGKK